ncbi:acyl-CoA dehydrogenase family protein [uncultured Methylobacterium sp.]|uniref:acyl-CoA dehydrogenase family protein n=1 Tax=uncultured Methylobacterium sp. TaxID=157278 RepID=UPI00259509C0|nr:acyl-CoA dehydrogenase family protein [uncultured Methylobacterium sp.]
MNASFDQGTGVGDDLGTIVLDQTDRILAQEVTPKLLVGCDGATGATAWCGDLWKLLDENGLPLALVSESAGGVGLDPGTAARLIRRCGFHALPLPLPETLAGAALWADLSGEPASGSLTLASKTIELAQVEDGFLLSGTLRGVPWGSQSSALLVDAVDSGGRRCVARIEGARLLDTQHNLAGEPRDGLDISGLVLPGEQVRAAPDWIAGSAAGAVETIGAWVRAQQLAGGLERSLAYAIQHVGERQQFGRPIGRFQAIQHMLAEAAGHVAAASAAADLAGAAWSESRFVLATAIAKSRCGEAAGRVAEVCQQVHGAMGFTHEHPLHHTTRRLWSWRDEFGHEALWQERIGRLVCLEGGAALWPMLVRLRSGAQ